jgi:GDPmannose 4,6-dehydratase
VDKENKTAIITGITGQDSSYLSEILLDKGYKVIGIQRRSSTQNDWRVQHLHNNDNFVVESGDITDQGSIQRIVSRWKPDEFYNLAAQSHVGISFNEAYHTSLVTGLGAVVCLEALRNEKPDTKFYQAGSSEQFGRVLETPQTEKTPFNPLSPYAVAKCFAFEMTKVYRESFGMFACAGILFNHESPRRGLNFVTRKVTDAAAKIKVHGKGRLSLGNLDSYRDWGHAKDYCMAMYMMLQHGEPKDYVIATGETHSIRDLLDIAFGYVNLDWADYVVQDPRFMRPNDVNLLLGDSSKARIELGWKPQYDFKALIIDMVESDLERYGQFPNV